MKKIRKSIHLSNVADRILKRLAKKQRSSQSVLVEDLLRAEALRVKEGK